MVLPCVSESDACIGKKATRSHLWFHSERPQHQAQGRAPSQRCSMPQPWRCLTRNSPVTPGYKPNEFVSIRETSATAWSNVQVMPGIWPTRKLAAESCQLRTSLTGRTLVGLRDARQRASHVARNVMHCLPLYLLSYPGPCPPATLHSACERRSTRGVTAARSQTRRVAA